MMRDLAANYNPRLKEKEVIGWLERGKSIILVGPRQAGKTTLAVYLAKRLGGEYYSLDRDVDREIFSNTETALSETGDFFVVDEAQEVEGIGRILKVLHDRGKRFIVTGSGSFDVRKGVSDYLVGRAIRIELLTLSFEEYLLWKDERLWRLYKRERDRFWKGEQPKSALILKEQWKRYIVFGGYPEVVLKGPDLLRSIVDLYIFREALTYFNILEREKFRRTMKLLALNVGSLLNKESLAEAVGANYRTIERYLSILEETYVVFLARRREKSFASARKRPKYYFYDLGFRNGLLGDLRSFDVRTDRGALLENYVARRLREMNEEVIFLRKNGEVDFVTKDFLIEVKAGGKKPRKLVQYARELGLKPVVVRPGTVEERDGILFVPPWIL